MIQIIAHRGASRECLENTLPAFQRAIDLGADAVELDVHVTADGTVVVHHDPVIRGTSVFASCSGQPIASLTTAQVASFQLADGSAVPTLTEVAALLAGRLTLFCELKGAGSGRPSLDVLRRSGCSCAVHAFDHRLIADAAAYAPDIPRGVLEVSRHVDAASTPRAVQARDLWQLVEYIDESLIREVHGAGGRVIAWTANDPAVVERLAAWGVDGLCTDDVTMVRRVLAR